MLKSAKLFTSIWLFLVLVSFREDALLAVEKALEAGNAKELSLFFGSSVELNLVGEESIYSRVQAEMVLREFFDLYPPRSAQLRRSVALGDSFGYLLLNYRTAKDSFDLAVYYKRSAATVVVNKIRFEKLNR